MEYTNCAKCGKMFLRVTSPVCSECNKEEEQQFKKLKDYIEENPGMTIGQVSASLDIPIKRILKFLREGRIEMTEGNIEGLLRCQRCDKPLTSGLMCSQCKSEFGRAGMGLSRGGGGRDLHKGSTMHTRKDTNKRR